MLLELPHFIQQTDSAMIFAKRLQIEWICIISKFIDITYNNRYYDFNNKDFESCKFERNH